ncbi:MAG: hypothetical protein J5867_06920 [Prevotella sp.]|nr:hypothetical protein [Prevotella sp.]
MKGLFMKHVMIWIAALVAIACGLLVYESDFLWKVQELNLFLSTHLFFKEQMVVAAGMLSYLGTWFTQFFYHPWMGVTLLCAWWLLLMFLLKKTFSIPDRWASLLLIPIALLLITIVDMGYWIYMLKLRGHFFVATIGTTAAVALLWAFRSLPDKYWLRAVWMVLACTLGYPLIGIYALAATLLMAIWSWRLMSKQKSLVYSLIAILFVIAIPLICYRYVYHETNLANIYYVGLPLYFITEECHTYYIPFYLLALFMVVMVCLPMSPRKESSKKQKIWGWTIQAVVLALVVWGVVRYWYKDENFHHELKMQHLVEQTDWEGVLREAATQQDEPTRAIVMMRNLALSRLGRQGDDMYSYRNGSKRINAPFDMRMLLVNGTLIYYQYGMLNYCNRLCTELGVEFGWRAEHFKYMIRCALLEGDKQIARKYINIMKKTLFHDEWAEGAENLLNHPELIAKERELEPITHLLHYPNTLSTDQGFVERFLMKQLSNSSYPADPIFQEQSLLASLWMKDPGLFWYHFGHYVKLHPDGPIPIAYQEAAYLYGKLENRPNLDAMPFSQGVKDGFNRFMQGSANYEGMDIEEARELMYPLYGNTFYFDYYLMSNLPEY